MDCDPAAIPPSSILPILLNYLCQTLINYNLENDKCSEKGNIFKYDCQLSFKVFWGITMYVHLKVMDGIGYYQLLV